MDRILTEADIELLLTSINYSKKNIEDGDSPYLVKKEKLSHFDEVARKLRELRDSIKQ